MTAHFQTARDRAGRRGAGMVLFRPPEAERREPHWHMIETHLGFRRLRWHPGIDVWTSPTGERFPAEYAGARGWRYVSLASDQPVDTP